MQRLGLIAMVLALAGVSTGTAADLDLIAPIDGPVVRHFEPPATPYTAGHRGIDYGAPEGRDVVASAPGIVSFAGQVGDDLFVSIDHDGGHRTTYSYLSAVLVRRGVVVAQGDVVGRSGIGHGDDATPELHFGLRLDGDYVDPEPILIRSLRRNLWRAIYLAA